MDGKQEPVIDAEVVEDEAPTAVPAGDYTENGVPTFEHVRDRIEGRVATGIGAGELAGAAPEAKEVEDRFEARRQAGIDKLEEIRRSMRDDSGS
jgi:phage shock protein A